MKKIIILFLLITAVGLFFWATFGTHITLISSVERDAIGGDFIKYLTYFVRYLVGPEIPSISIPFWSGLVVFIVAVVLMRRARN